MNNKRRLRKLAIFLGIVAIFPACYLAYILFLQSDLYYTLHGVGDGFANISTWLDTNGNGIYDQGESPLPNVCVGYVGSLDDLIRRAAHPCDETDKTDSRGWGGSEFLPGWTDTIYKFSFPPEGYQPTTDMVSIDNNAQFGFVQEGATVLSDVKTVEEYIHNELIKRWARFFAIALIVFATAFYGTLWIEKAFFRSVSNV
ncbi:MAG: hypothetical protein IT314_01765 [Anaerolineales bacterium]|nr:hypothetical protein [Anaerolineales bacterium]